MATLTNTRVRAAKPRSKVYELTCGGLAGFALRVLPSGKKVFVVRRRVDGRDQRVRIGLYEAEVTLEEARRRAAVILGGGDLEEVEDPRPAGRIGHRRASPGTPVEGRMRPNWREFDGGDEAPWSTPRPARGARSQRGEVALFEEDEGPWPPRSASAARSVRGEAAYFDDEEATRLPPRPARGARSERGDGAHIDEAAGPWRPPRLARGARPERGDGAHFEGDGGPWLPPAPLAQAPRQRGRHRGAATWEPPPLAPRRVTIRELSERFLVEYVDVYLKRSTALNYRQILVDYVVPALGHLDFREVARADVQRLHASLRDRPAAANYMLCVVGSLYSRIIKDWELADLRNPASSVRRFRARKVERFLTAEERSSLEGVLQRGIRLPVAAPGYVAPMAVFAIKLLALTGLRRSEILDLTWPMIDWQHAVLNLPDTKTGQRSVPVSSQVVALLREIHAFCGEPRAGFVVRSRSGKPLASLGKTWERVRELAGIPDVRLHDLRHSFASDALMGGVPLAVIGKMLGHRQLTTTQRYAHLADRVVRDALEQTASRITEAVVGAVAAAEEATVVKPFKPLTNTQWSRIARLVETGSKRSQPLMRGVVDGVRWRIHHAAPWQGIPKEYGRTTTCWRWFQRWEADGTWAEIERRLGEGTRSAATASAVAST